MNPNNIPPPHPPAPTAPPPHAPQLSGIYPNVPQDPPQQADNGQAPQAPGVEGSQTQSDTHVNVGLDPQPSYVPPPDKNEEPGKTPISAPERAVTGIVAGILSLVTIGLAFATFQNPYHLFKNPSGPLAVGIITTSLNLIALAWVLFTLANRTTSRGALLPIFFAGLGGMMIVIFFAAAQTNKVFENVDINLTAVMNCAAVFGGISLGATAEYLAFARNR